MDDTPHHSRPAGRDPPMPGEAELLAALAESEAEAESGLFVSGDEVLRELLKASRGWRAGRRRRMART